MDELCQRIEELLRDIDSKKETIAQKQAEIDGMHGRVADAERRSADAVKEHQRRTAEIEASFAEKTKVL